MWTFFDIQFFVLLMVGSSIATHPFFRFPLDTPRYQAPSHFLPPDETNSQLRGYYYSSYPADGQATGVQFLTGSNIFGLTSQDFHTRIGSEFPLQDHSYYYQASPYVYQRPQPVPQLPQFYHPPSSFGSQHYQYQQQFNPPRIFLSNGNQGNSYDPVVSFIQTKPQYTNLIPRVTEPEVQITTLKPEIQEVHVEKENITETTKINESKSIEKNVADDNDSNLNIDVDKQDSMVTLMNTDETTKRPENDGPVQEVAPMVKEDQSPEN